MPERSELSHDEHRARAMLMGMVYDWRDHTYNKYEEPPVTVISMVDADTMEEISNGEAFNRRLEWGTSHCELGSEASLDTPRNPKEVCYESSRDHP